MTGIPVPEAVSKLLHKVALSWNIAPTDLDAMIADDTDRMHSIVAIASGTWSLYRDQDAVRAWLREPAKLLDGKAPLDIMPGHPGLARVKEYVEHLAGR